jgi:hypothetical protein
MSNISDSKLSEILARPGVPGLAAKLAEIAPGLYSRPELAHRVAGENRIDRSDFYCLLDALLDVGELETFSVWHNKTPLRCIEIEPDRLREFFAGIE